MKITIDHLLELIDELPKSHEFEYVKPGNYYAVLGLVNKLDQTVEITKVAKEDHKSKSAGLTTESLNRITKAVIAYKPFSVDSIFNGSGSARSTWEAILANTSEFYACKVGALKHLVWVPDSKHEIGVIKDIDLSTLPEPEDDDEVQSVLEPSVANYLTKHDDEDLSSKDLVKIFQRAYNESKKGEQGTIANLFGILYAPHIENIPKNGENSIAEMALGKGGYGSMGDEIGRGISIGLELRKHIQKQNNLFKEVSKITSTPTNYDKYLRALRTKPFMLLAGISGTGKSRIVRELAFKSCPEYLRDADGTTPGNYLMVEVKPNWHDSSELLGYYSHLANNGNGGYVFTPFTKFLVKAMMFPNVPFFVCLDEMNLAPVEQYFAEFLSVLETRKHDKDNYIQTGVLVKPEYFQGISDHVGDGYICTEFFPDGLPKIDYPVYTNTILTNKGLSLPDNVFVIGTVNMDDTTHQFSRKVIDRAMTIEMNGGKLTEMFGHSADLEYLPADQVWELEKFLPQYVNADEVVAAHPEYEWLIQTQLPTILDEINDVLRDTPFQISYRVLNEMVIYFSVLVESGMPSEEAKNLAVDQMLLMKILPRIEGDRDMLMLDAQTCRLDKLEPFAASEDTKKKIAEMKNRLNKQEFTRFWP